MVVIGKTTAPAAGKRRQKGKNMKYTLFIHLYSEALEYDNVDTYIAERGWQDWMDTFEDPVKISSILTSIYNLANSTLTDIRTTYGLSRAQFSRLFLIPLRTVESWEAQVRQMPTYSKCMLAFAIFNEFLWGEPNEED